MRSLAAGSDPVRGGRGPAGTDASLRRRGHGRVQGGRRWRTYLVCVLTAAAGASLFYGSLTPRFYPADEQSHTAYAVEIRRGVLPDIDTPLPADLEPPGSDGARIHVANHPPLFPVLQAAMATTAGWAGVEDAELTAGRALNVLCNLAAVVAVAALGRSMTDSRRLGVLSAALFAALPALWSLASFGYSDGLGVLATVLVAWAGVRAWKRPGQGSWTLVSTTMVLAGLSRGSAVGPALAVGALVTAQAWAIVASGGSRWSGDGPNAGRLDTRRVRVARAGQIALRIFGPTGLIAGWWYIRNTVRFGDPLASTELLHRLRLDNRFARPRPGGLLGTLANLEIWRDLVTDLAGSVYAPNVGLPRPRLDTGVFWVMAGFAAAAVASLIASAVKRRIHGGEPARLGLPVIGIVTAVVVVGVFRHIAAGGGAHPRYLLSVFALLIVVVVAGLDRLHRRGPVIAVTAMCAASLMLLAQSRRWMADESDVFGLAVYGPAGWRVLAVGLIVLGLAGSAAAFMSDRRSPSGEAAREKVPPDRASTRDTTDTAR